MRGLKSPENGGFSDDFYLTKLTNIRPIPAPFCLQNRLFLRPCLTSKAI